MKMELSEKDINFELNNKEVSFKLPFEEYEGHKDMRFISFQVEYMRNAWKLTLKSKELYITLNTPFQPILLDNQEDVQVVVLPVRTY